MPPQEAKEGVGEDIYDKVLEEGVREGRGKRLANSTVLQV